MVQPYGRYEAKLPAAIGQERRYQVELWPIGNRFRAGHRLRLYVLGASSFSFPSLPAVNTVRLGGTDGSQLHLPVLPAEALVAASSVASANRRAVARGDDVDLVVGVGSLDADRAGRAPGEAIAPRHGTARSRGPGVGAPGRRPRWPRRRAALPGDGALTAGRDLPGT